jgi:nucleotide-binding universal stress UspA family protein
MTDTQHTARAKIVAGVDGSAVGDEAAEWAYREAVLHGADLELVHCWDYPYYGTLDMVGLDEKIRDTSARAAHAALSGALERLRASHPDGPVEVTGVSVQGGAGWSLVERGRDALMIVVGSRGRGGFAGLLLGSTSHTVVSHATVPVLVVRHERHTTHGRGHERGHEPGHEPGRA